LSKTIRVRYVNGVLIPLDKVEFKEGEEFEILIQRGPSHVFGVLRRRRPDIKPEEIDRIIEEIEDEGAF